MRPPQAASTKSVVPILVTEIPTPLRATARGVVLDGIFRMGAAAFILSVHDHVPAGAQLPDVASQIHVAVFQADRVADAQPIAHLFTQVAAHK